MSSPSKRRKLNDQQSPSKNRSLEYFFGKQKSTPVRSSPLVDASAAAVENGSFNSCDGDIASSDNPISDEELARRLQAQFDAEERDRDAQQTSTSDNPTTTQQKLSPPPSNTLPDRSTTTHDLKQAKATGQTLSLQSSSALQDSVTASIPFDENPLAFDPQQWVPQLRDAWQSDGGRASYALLTRCFILVNSTTSRIKIVDTLVNLLRVLIEGDPESLLPAVWLSTNAISPPYISLELGLGGSAISKGLKKAFGLDNAGLKSLYDKHGDAGDVAAEAKKKQTFTLRKPKPLTINGVYQSLVKIANIQGNKSQDFKQQIVDRLLQDCQGTEQSRYLVRTFCQHLRIGAVKTTMLIALSRAFLLSRPAESQFPIKDRSELATLDKKQLAAVWSPAEELVKACFARRPNYNDIVPTLLQVGVSEEILVLCGLAVHIPLRPMLGSITRDLSEMLVKLQGRDFTCEYKYDGQRAQVHCDDDGRVSIFSRHLEVMTDKYPDLVAMVPQIRGDGVKSFILEGEVVAIDRETGELKGFQTLTNRARKDVQITSVTIDVCLYAFDLMYLNGEQLLNLPLRERRSLLRSMFLEQEHRFTWVKSIDATSADSETVLEFFKSATDIKCEGIMVKVLDNVPGAPLPLEEIGREISPSPTPAPKATGKASKKADKTPEADEANLESKTGRRKALLATYEPDKRLDSWLKVKKDYDSTVFDTLDLIPIGAWHGQGRKAKWWSPILLAVRNPETGSLEAVTKCISGFTDKFYQAHKEKYAEDGNNVISRPSYVEYPGHPDVWFEPQEVWEVAFADITLSPTYLAAMGLVSDERGLSTRFPRFLKVREDKGIDEASTSEFLAGLWHKQEARSRDDQNNNNKGGKAQPVDDGDEDEGDE